MDDYLESIQTVEQATRNAQDLVKLLTFGGFTLTKFVTNVQSIASQIPIGRKLPKNDNKVLPTVENLPHVLGLRWNYRADTLVVSRGLIPDLKTAIAQRVVLSIVSSVYNPIRLVVPYTVKATLLLKNIWKLNERQRYDDSPEAIVNQFSERCKKLPLLREIGIPRSYIQEAAEILE